MYFNIPGHDTMIYKFLGLPSFTNTKTINAHGSSVLYLYQNIR